MSILSELIQDDDYTIVNSPNMSEKIEAIDIKVTNIEQLLKKISSKLENNKSQYVVNKNEYLDMLQKIEEISKSNKQILQENRKMYTEALEKIQNTEVQNMDEIRPILNDMNTNTQKLESNICDPLLNSRMLYRSWRNFSFLPNFTQGGNLNGLLGIPFISSFKDVKKTTSSKTVDDNTVADNTANDISK